MATIIEAAAAVKHFAGKGVMVQEAAPVNAKGEDGKARAAYETEMVSLHARHVLAARDYGDRVTITTIDGQRHEAEKLAEKAGKKDGDKKD